MLNLDQLVEIKATLDNCERVLRHAQAGSAIMLTYTQVVKAQEIIQQAYDKYLEKL